MTINVPEFAPLFNLVKDLLNLYEFDEAGYLKHVKAGIPSRVVCRHIEKINNLVRETEGKKS